MSRSSSSVSSAPTASNFAGHSSTVAQHFAPTPVQTVRPSAPASPFHRHNPAPAPTQNPLQNPPRRNTADPTNGGPRMTLTPTTTPTNSDATPRLFVHRVGTGHPLVLLHGMGESHVGWRPVIDALAADHDVIAIDLPGFGASPALPAHLPPTAANL